MKRLFTGIAVDGDEVPKLVERVDALRAGHPDLRWSERSGWHVTLQFYGMVDAAQEGLLREQLRGVEAGCVEVILRGIGTFERAGALWAGVDLTEELEALQGRVMAVGEVCGFAREERPYRPHVTLARRKGRGGRWDFKKGWEMDAGVEFGVVRAREFVLYESVAGPGGSRYDVVDRYGLKG
ncbi:MAG: RNA 2',3'-cyclic phosphodiesterase [Acidobacteriaceae bacterium]